MESLSLLLPTTILSGGFQNKNRIFRSHRNTWFSFISFAIIIDLLSFGPLLVDLSWSNVIMSQSSQHESEASLHLVLSNQNAASQFVFYPATSCFQKEKKIVIKKGRGNCGKLSDRKANNLAMARLVQLPPKYVPEEWHTSNSLQYLNAEHERAAAERLRDESERLRYEIEVTTKRTQMDVNKKLEQRITDINFWKSELDQKQEDTQNEIAALLKFKARLEKALEDTDLPLMIAQQCLANREKRIKIDLVHDNVEIQLLKEVETIEGVQALLKRTLEQTTEQIRRLRSARYYLEKDRKDKFQALDIDSTCAGLTNQTGGIHYAKDVVKIEKNSTTPQEWETFSNKNILKAERERNSGIQLRSIIDGILIQTLNDLQNQCNAVNLAFEKRIEETSKAKTKLEEHLAKVMEEISAMETNIARLKQAIEDKEAPMKVSQTRLENRTLRPNVELCRDRVQYRLIDEVIEISSNIERLQEQLANAEESLKGLIRKQLSLEEDIEVKDNSLFIDRDQCMELRKQINHVPH